MKTKRNLIQSCLLCAAIILSAIAAIPCRALTLADALDTPGWTYTNDCGTCWSAETQETFDGVAAVLGTFSTGGCGQCGGPISIQTTVTGPARISFYSSVGQYCGASFSWDGNGASSIRLPVNLKPWRVWSQSFVYLGSGTHVIRWTLFNNNLDPSFDPTQISMFLDQVALAPPTTPVITQQPQSITRVKGDAATFTATVFGADPMTYQWRLNTTNLLAATNVSLTITNVQPEDAGPYSLVVSNSCSTATSSNALLTLLPPQPTITTASPLPAGVAGTAYSKTLAVSGSTTPFFWSLVDGSLPSGLSLSTNGVISGTPDLATNASFTVQVLGGNGLSTNKVFGLTINPAITTTSPLPAGAVGVAYNQTLAASGGTSPYVWIITAGGLPTGLNLSTNGAITGTPTMLTNASFTVQVTDNNGLSSTKTLSLTVASPPTITTASPLPAGVAGTAYSTTLAVSGSTSPYLWSLGGGQSSGWFEFEHEWCDQRHAGLGDECQLHGAGRGWQWLVHE